MFQGVSKNVLSNDTKTFLDSMTLQTLPKNPLLLNSKGALMILSFIKRG
jgi:hypothetical protein